MKIWLLFILIFSCVRKPNVTTPSFSGNNEPVFQSQNNLVSLKISALNLSEDMSKLSTKNDEIFVFLYDHTDTNKLNSPIVSEKMIFDKMNLTHSVSFSQKDNLILFFIEEDSFRNTEQIEPVVRVYFKEIMNDKSYENIRKYLGEDDLLGVQFINSKTSTFTISGMSSLDKYKYSFVIK